MARPAASKVICNSVLLMRSLWRFDMSIPGNIVDEVQLVDVGENSRFSSYPIDMSSFLTLPHCKFDAEGIPNRLDLEAYDPTIIAQYALANWNQYLATNDEVNQRAFLALAY